MNSSLFRILGATAGFALVSCASNPWANTPPRREKPDSTERYGQDTANKNNPNPYLASPQDATKPEATSPAVTSPPTQSVETTTTTATTQPAPPSVDHTTVTTTQVAPPPVVAAPSSSLPFGAPVPGKPGFVYSPYDKTAGMIDVKDIAPGTKVRDPYTGKIFLVP